MVMVLFLLIPYFLFSAEFTASVNRNKVALGESFMLDLSLKDASAKTPPLVDPLKQAFIIHSQHQSSKMMMMNGKVSSSVNWTLLVVPKVAGEIQIPSIGIETSEGKLFTQPIEMTITQERDAHGNTSEGEIRLETETSSLSPYKNEPFFLTLRLISKQSLANLHADKFELEGAIVEQAEEPVIGQMLEKGIKSSVIEFKYLVTPLKSGLLKIPPVTIHGAIPQKRNRGSLFDLQSLYDDSFDPFSSMLGLVSTQPFALATKELSLEIRSPIGGMSPWLPARNLEIQENFDDSQTFREGEVFSRSFVISAEGVHSSQLPSLEDKQATGHQFKVYADKPELEDEIVDGKLRSYRIEHFTLIPQKSGELTLPAISVSWWDTGKSERQETLIPSRSLQVLPAPLSRVSAAEDVAVLDEKEPFQREKKESSSLMENIPPPILLLIGGLTTLLVIVLVLLVSMKRKMNRLLEVPREKKIAPSNELKREFIPISTVDKSEPSRRKREKLDDLNPT